MDWVAKYLTHSMQQSPSQKLTVPHPVKKFLTLYGIQRFITAFTSACHLSLSWARLIQSMPPNPTFSKSILALSSHRCLCVPSGLLPSGLPTKMFMHLSYLPSPAHLILLDLFTQVISGEYRAQAPHYVVFMHSKHDLQTKCFNYQLSICRFLKFAASIASVTASNLPVLLKRTYSCDLIILTTYQCQ